VIPECWKTKQLEDCCIGKAEYGANASAIDYNESLPRYIRITDIDDNGSLIEDTKVSVTLEGNEGYLLKENDFLFARTGATVGKTYLHQEPDVLVVYAGYLIKFTLNPKVLLPEYLKHYTQTERYWRWVRNTVHAGAQPNINAREYSSMPISVPSLPEQQKTVDILSTWGEAIALIEQRIDAARQRKKGLMQRLLTGRVRFPEFVHSQEMKDTKLGVYPKEWSIRQLSDVVKIQVSYVDKKSKPSEHRVCLCNYMDVFNNDYVHNQMDFMEASATEAEIQKCALRAQDVVITKDSETREEIAESCVVTEDLKNVVCGYHLAILRPKKSSISGFFLKDALRSPQIHHQFVKSANGITRFGLTVPVIHNALIMVPQLEEQERIATVLQTCDREIELLERKRDALQRQKKGLMQRLLTGRVQV
jgi:type I restriction enzyme, S subunit